MGEPIQQPGKTMNLIKPANILVVDDDGASCRLLATLLAPEGHAVRNAASGEAALEAVAEQLPDLILLDIILPGIDGFEVTRRLKSDSRTSPIPIILVTSLTDRESRLKGLEAGANEFLTKPVDRAELLVRVRNLLKLNEYQNFLVKHNAILKEQIRENTAVLQESEEKFRKISESAQDAIIMMGQDQRISFWNTAAARIFGYTAAEAMGQELHALIVPTLVHAKFSLAFPHFQETGEGPIIGKVVELTALRKGGEEFSVDLSVSATQLNGQWHAIGIVRDITERKQAEAKILETQAELQRLLDAANQSRRALLSVIQDQERAKVALQHANRALATLSAVNRNLVHATDENELLQTICQSIVEQRGYRSAWVGYVQNDAAKTIRPMAQSGFEAGYLDTLPLTWADNEYGQSPTGRAVRSGVTQISRNILLDPTYTAWREQALKLGFAASIALPLRSNNNGVFGNLSIYAAEADAFDQAEITLLEEMAEDLAFGVRALHTRHERDLALVKNREQLVQLQDSLENTVRAMAAIVEMRDPYTAGHQVRVADLSVVIAKQMALPEEQIHTIHLAGIVHDLGKIKVPAEILSKPGKINDLEFGLIKIHPQAGYDILKGIDFPWPIAQMVLQHHERLDGSGYPQGLKGEAILLEARILAVADVVEAMYSHRPYRPGLGIDVALAEITKQRGTHYDPQVVDACLAVFRDQHYSFKN